MHSYRIHNLSVDTSPGDRQRLFERIRALAGVENVTVAADRGEISISLAKGDSSSPDRAALAEAVAAAGFVLRGRADRWTG
jgi:hypothetical protein